VLRAASALSKLSECGLSRSDALDITAHLAGVEYRYATLHAGKLAVDEKRFEATLRRVLKHEPAAYITGHKEFYGLEFDLTPNIFIPRPESELLVELAIKEKPARVLDLCTGTGAILISILHRLENSSGMGVDISPYAVETAKHNALKLGVSAEFICADILKESLPYGDFDLITMNPPYLSEREYAVSGESIFYEPKIALVAENEGYHFYNIILRELKKFNNMLLLAEIGAAQGEHAAELAEGLGFEVSVFTDLARRNRVIRAYKK
jgi:release factor glutamine methyltransferase